MGNTLSGSADECDSIAADCTLSDRSDDHYGYQPEALIYRRNSSKPSSSSSNNANIKNSNNDEYWRQRGYRERPSDVGDVHASYFNVNNPNNPSYGAPAVHPNVAQRYACLSGNMADRCGTLC